MEFLEFEKKYKNILENIEEWGAVRFKIGMFFKHNNDYKLFFKKKNFISKLKKIKSVFYGYKNWFRKYDYLVFSDSNERKLIENKYFDKSFDDWIIQEKTLFIEQLATNNYYPISEVYSSYIASGFLLNLLSKLFTLFFKDKCNEELKSILIKENILFNIDYELNYLKSSYYVYLILLRIYKPKKIFISCFYCRPSLIKAAKRLNIEVIDVQHGIINEVHFGYVSDIKINNEYVANILFSFGNKEKQINNLLIKKVIPIGNFYLDYLKKNFKEDERIKILKKGYKFIVGFTVQDQVEWELVEGINFLNEVAKLNKDILFLVIPRREKIELNLEENVKVIDFLNCYNIILHCDLHTSIYSSCAIEVPYFGIPNVLFNIKNFAKKYYENRLNSKNTLFIDYPIQFRESFYKLIKLNKEFIIESNESFVKYNRKRIRRILFNEN